VVLEGGATRSKDNVSSEWGVVFVYVGRACDW
jgi:hypothetical protein